MDNFEEKIGYFKLKEEALDRTPRRTRFGRSYGPVVKQTIKLMNNKISIIDHRGRYRNALQSTMKVSIVQIVENLKSGNFSKDSQYVSLSKFF